MRRVVTSYTPSPSTHYYPTVACTDFPQTPPPALGPAGCVPVRPRGSSCPSSRSTRSGPGKATRERASWRVRAGSRGRGHSVAPCPCTQANAHQRLVGDDLGAGKRRLAAFGDDFLHFVGTHARVARRRVVHHHLEFPPTQWMHIVRATLCKDCAGVARTICTSHLPRDRRPACCCAPPRRVPPARRRQPVVALMVVAWCRTVEVRVRLRGWDL